MEFNNLIELIRSVPDEKACREYLIKERWNGVIVCPYCKKEGAYVIEGGKRFKCKSSACYKKFSVTVKTFMEASNIPLVKWLTGIYLVTAHKKGISSHQLGRDLGVAQKNSWFMLMRIRAMIKQEEGIILGNNDAVEADETHIGGKFSNMHSKKRKAFNETGDSLANKTTVLGVIERGGKLVAKVIPPKSTIEIPKTIAEVVKPKATFITDSTNIYDRITNGFNHHSVNHTMKEYVRGDSHTNTIEGVFSHMKRMVYGIYHQISAKHTQRYCDEFAFRHNSRDIKDPVRFNYALTFMEGRLTYKKLIATEAPKAILIEDYPDNRYKGIIQVKNGEVVAHYPSLKAAARASGINRKSIRNACRGDQKTAGGYKWIYA